MKPIDQTRFGKPHGNCLMACVASVLEIPLDECPDISDESTWWKVTETFIRERGYEVLYLDNTQVPFRPGGYHIGGGTSPRGLSHVCVFLDGRMVHDPHPSRAGIDHVREWFLLYPRGEAATTMPPPAEPTET